MRRLLCCVLLLVSATANASLVPYEFTAQVDGINPATASLLPVGLGDVITGGFLFDDAAPRTSFSQCADCNYDGSLFISGVRTNATYDESNFALWARLGSYLIAASGTTLTIQDVPTGTYAPDQWHLPLVAFGQDAGNGLRTDSIQIIMNDWFRGPLTSGDLQVFDPVDWHNGPFNDQRLNFSFAGPDGPVGFGSHLVSVTSVPEPGTLFLLSTGLIALGVRRRKRSIASP